MSRSVLVTGAAGGLAAGIAVSLARDGFDRVALTYRRTSPDRTVASLTQAGAAAAAFQIDFLAPENEIQDALATIVRENGPFDAVVHAVGPMVVKRFERTTMDDYREMFDGNVRSAVMVAHAVLPSMRERGFGRIVFFGMNGSAQTLPYRGFTLHQAAKSAVVAFARCLAVEEAKHNITVNVIEPGHIKDKGVTRDEALGMSSPSPRGRAGSYEDVADVVAFLVAPERDYVTGAVIAVTGGLTEADERNAPTP
ncbi:MAG TPA: SDR family oxidoreductase [Candidatus Aquilonibacter sp.]|nr:SDR family oxidoreductase [Candidatus Aquilonibacter sp.]